MSVDSVFPFDFRTRRPAGPVGRLVESIWYARGTVPYVRERISPTGSTVAVFVLGDPIIHRARNGAGTTLRAERGFLVGPHDGPAINEPTGETYAVGIVTSPIGCEAALGLRPSGLRGTVVDLETAWGSASSLRRRLLATDSPGRELDLLEAHLTAVADYSITGLDRCEEAVRLLQTDPERPIGEVAASLGLSHGHLDSEFTRIVGLTPRALARLLRMRLLLKEVDAAEAASWSDLATRFGWFDQAHMIRDFKRHTGTTPTRYLEVRRKTYPPSEAAPGFVPEV